MERAIIYYAKTGLEATDHFVPELLEKYCKDNGYEIVAMLSEPASTEGVSFPMKYAFSGKRIHRGMYQCANGKCFNADVNGALNILRKSNVVSLDTLYSRGEVDTPIRIRIA